jgi:hypothetical protein
MMGAQSGLLWSPWFRVIAENFLGKWWEDLPKSLSTNHVVDLDTIHRFDCKGDMFGGAGGAGAWLDVNPVASEDKWLAAVAANGGKAPDDADEMKPFLVKNPALEGAKGWKLVLPNDEPTSLTTGQACNVAAQAAQAGEMAKSCA